MIGRRIIEKVESNTIFELDFEGWLEFAKLGEGLNESQESV